MTEKTVKIHRIEDKLYPGVSYNWTAKIGRDLENNPVIIKASPSFMAALQTKDPSLVSSRAILQKICQGFGIPWDDKFVEFALVKKVDKPTAVANTTTFSF